MQDKGWAVALAAAVLSAMPVGAQDGGKPGVSFSGEATFVSDYRFRGISLSNRDPAVQAGIQMDTAAGFYVGLWGSSIADFNGATTEIDVYGGWTGDAGAVTLDVGIIGYLYPGGVGTDYYELYGSVGGTLGPAELTVGLNVAPNQDNLSRSNRYLYGTLGVGIPATPLSLSAGIGFERGGLVPDETGERTTKTDWSLGADLTFEPITIGIAYVDTNLPSRFRAVPFSGLRANEFGKGTVVLKISASF